MIDTPVHFDAESLTVALVERLVAAQFPQWAGLSIAAAVPQGWDNRTFRLGTDMSVRLPSGVGYAPQVEHEHRFLPGLASRLPLPIPVPIARGTPGEGYPFAWSISRWLPGETAVTAHIHNMYAFATTLARFLTALQQIAPLGGPPPGPHSGYRGGPLITCDAETSRSIAALSDMIDAAAATAVWDTAIAAPWHGPPVWFHGDMAVGNLLVRDGELSAVIDWGCAGVGDPACDVTIAWTFFVGDSREAFRAALPLDRATWTRGRGWALWKALLTLAGTIGIDPPRADAARRVIDDVIAEQRAGA